MYHFGSKKGRCLLLTGLCSTDGPLPSYCPQCLRLGLLPQQLKRRGDLKRSSVFMCFLKNPSPRIPSVASHQLNPSPFWGGSPPLWLTDIVLNAICLERSWYVTCVFMYNGDRVGSGGPPGTGCCYPLLPWMQALWGLLGFRGCISVGRGKKRRRGRKRWRHAPWEGEHTQEP